MLLDPRDFSSFILSFFIFFSFLCSKAFLRVFLHIEQDRLETVIGKYVDRQAGKLAKGLQRIKNWWGAKKNEMKMIKIGGWVGG